MNHATGIAALVTGMILVWFVPGGDFLAPWPLTYATVYLGSLNPRRIFLLLGADYSYGLFLYGYPIQQSLVAILPNQTPLFNTIASTFVAGAFAAFSWHLVEKPALKMRAPLKRLEDRYLAARARNDEASGLAPRSLS